jgi:hypothetical protein
MESKSRSKLAFNLSAAIFLVVLLFVSALWWLEVSKQFPEIPAGSYHGSISDIDADAAKLPIYLERGKESTELLFVVFGDGWDTQIVRPLRRSDVGIDQSSANYPLMLNGPEITLRLMGSKIGQGKFGGIATELESGKEGRWYIEPLVGSPKAIKTIDQFKLPNL